MFSFQENFEVLKHIAKCPVTSSFKFTCVYIIRLDVSFYYLRTQNLKPVMSVEVEGHLSLHTWLNSACQ